MKRTVIIATTITLFFGVMSPAHGHEREFVPDARLIYYKPRVEISSTRYLAGGLLGTFLGFGIGHVVQGRWTRTGWIFTFGEMAMLGMLYGGAISLRPSFDRRRNEKKSSLGIGLLIAGTIGFVLLRAGEIGDVWRTPSDMIVRRFTARQLSKKNLRPQFAFAPSISPTGAGLDLSLKF